MPSQSYISEEIGAGKIRDDVQNAIAREIDARLCGEPDKNRKEISSGLSRKEKELILMAIACLQQRACIAELHARASVLAGATLPEVVEVAVLTILSGGMPQFKRAGMPAIQAARSLAGNDVPAATSRVDRDAPKGADRMSEIHSYVERTLRVDWPDMFAVLETLAPYALDGYMRIRQGVLDDEGAASKHLKELVMTAMDLQLGNAWGAPLHGKQALLDGATDQQLVETVALAMIECGLHVYLTGGEAVIRITKMSHASN